MVHDDMSSRVRSLISDFKQRAGPNVTSPEDVCRYVSLHLGISEASARDLIVGAALREAEQHRRKRGDRPS
jgi:hypothetical protein